VSINGSYWVREVLYLIMKFYFFRKNWRWVDTRGGGDPIYRESRNIWRRGRRATRGARRTAIRGARRRATGGARRKANRGARRTATRGTNRIRGVITRNLNRW
jgi:hypothetical protein